MMAFHHVSPDSKVFIDLVLFEEVYFLQGMIHFLLFNPFLLRHKTSLFVDELSDPFAAYCHILIRIFLLKLYNMIIIGMQSFIEIEEILAHVGEVPKEVKNYNWCHILLIF